MTFAVHNLSTPPVQVTDGHYRVSPTGADIPATQPLFEAETKGEAEAWRQDRLAEHNATLKAIRLARGAKE